MYYRLDADLEKNPDALYGLEYDLAGMDKDFPTSTYPAKEWPAEIRFYTKGTIAMDLIATVLTWALVSKRVKDFLEQLDPEAVECLPVQVFRLETGESVPGYYVLHVLREVAAFDREHGFYRIIGDYFQVIKIALRREAVEGLHIFRLAERNRFPYCSSEVVKRLEGIGATGLGWFPIPAF